MSHTQFARCEKSLAAAAAAAQISTLGGGNVAFDRSKCSLDISHGRNVTQTVQSSNPAGKKIAHREVSRRLVADAAAAAAATAAAGVATEAANSRRSPFDQSELLVIIIYGRSIISSRNNHCR